MPPTTRRGLQVSPLYSEISLQKLCIGDQKHVTKHLSSGTLGSRERAQHHFERGGAGYSLELVGCRGRDFGDSRHEVGGNVGEYRLRVGNGRVRNIRV